MNAVLMNSKYVYLDFPILFCCVCVIQGVHKVYNWLMKFCNFKMTIDIVDKNIEFWHDVN